MALTDLIASKPNDDEKFRPMRSRGYIPTDVMDLVEPRGALDFMTWSTFAPYQWFYVKGFIEAYLDLSVMAGLRGRDRIGVTKFSAEYASRAPDALPPQWRERLPDLNWKQLSPGQIQSRALKNIPCPFDKAALAILSLAEYSKDLELDPSKFVFDKISIAPAFYIVSNFTPRFWQQQKDEGGKELVQDLGAFTLQLDHRVFDKLAENYSCTHWLAARVVEFFSIRGISNLSVNRLNFRSDPMNPRLGKGLHCNNFELCCLPIKK